LMLVVEIASIFSTSDVQEVPHTSAMDVTAAYKV
jgi:hypothetical protein